MVLAEAMNYGKAIISVHNTTIAEVVEEGKTGLLVPTLDAHAFAEAVLALLNDNLLRHEMGQIGKDNTKAAFRWDSIANQYEAVLESARKSKETR